MSQEIPYRPQDVESKWQRRWAESRTFAVPPAAEASGRPRCYVLEMFPYPSGRLHMGHVRNYSIGDVLARFKRARGFEVLHPMGWDAFGLPAENAAIQKGVHPAKWTRSNIAVMREQLKRLGFGYDWDRELATCDPAYYRFEQEVFLGMLERGLAYKKGGLLNWCESCQTTLANEQVEDGRCWRCGGLVTQRELQQWYLRITAYAQELLDCLGRLDGWPDAVRAQQEAWIGRSEGAAITFPVEGGEPIDVFTTRPDTLYGCSFLSLAPEHPQTRRLAAGTPQEAAVAAFVDEMGRTDKALRMDEAAEKRGVWTGRHALHPLTGARVPVWTANFVLADYGTGAVMAVPAHDQRDFEFAKRHGLPLVKVIEPPAEAGWPAAVADWDRAWTDAGTMTASGPHDGVPSEEGKRRVTAELAACGSGRGTVNFRLRDWGISRQRYWGAPIPVVYCDACGMRPVPRAQLPVVLPEDVLLDGLGGSPLARHAAFVAASCPDCGGPARRETDTFDTFMESSWYFVRYLSPRAKVLVDSKESERFLPVDQYIGGIEHAVMHLLYARFFTKVLRDLGMLAVDEPFARLLCQGMVCHETYRLDGQWLAPDEVERGPEGAVHKASRRPVEIGRVEKMSKSKRNTVDPEALVARFGADTMRLFCLFTAPPEKDLDWSDAGVEGASRFIQRIWRLLTRRAGEIRGAAAPPPQEALPPGAADLRRAVHRTIRRVSDDIERRMQFNTAIAAVMELWNELSAWEAPQGQPRALEAAERAVLAEASSAVLQLLSPMAPHVCDELWELLGGEGLLEDRPWPAWDPEIAKEAVLTLAVQVQGKLRGTVEVAPGAAQAEVEALALGLPAVQKQLDGRAPRRVVHVPGKLVNVVP